MNKYTKIIDNSGRIFLVPFNEKNPLIASTDTKGTSIIHVNGQFITVNLDLDILTEKLSIELNEQHQKNTRNIIMQKVVLATELTEEQADALSQFVKRVGFKEFAENSSTKEEAHLIASAISEVQDSLSRSGYSPR